jgi:hypothetical protein
MKSEPRYVTAFKCLCKSVNLNPSMTAIIWPRLHAGHEEYGDKSWDMSQKQIINEIREECCDVIGWSTFIYDKLPEKDKELLDIVIKLQSISNDLLYKLEKRL